jgi:hypothetical protein
VDADQVAADLARAAVAPGAPTAPGALGGGAVPVVGGLATSISTARVGAAVGGAVEPGRTSGTTGAVAAAGGGVAGAGRVSPIFGLRWDTGRGAAGALLLPVASGA